MLLTLHIFTATFSIVWATVVLFRPTWNKLLVSYGLIGATLLSGGYLVLTLHANMLHVCLTGLAYLTVVLGMTILAHRKYETLALLRSGSDQKNQ